jgi:dehydrogenase/reductase SDR family member 4
VFICGSSNLNLLQTGASMFSLKGKVALITGSTKGIGKSIAEEMANAGAKVVISSRKADACDAVTAEFTARGQEALAVPCNVGDKAAAQNLVDTVMKKWGRIDCLVCNAASNPHFGPLTTASDDVFDKIMQTNVKSVFWLANMVLPQMAGRGEGGSMIIISSIGALRGSTVIGLYGTSKAAEAGLCRGMGAQKYPREYHPAGTDQNRFCQGAVVRRRAPHGARSSDALAPYRRTQGHWWRGGVSGDGRRGLCVWTNDRGGWRGDDFGVVVNGKTTP